MPELNVAIVSVERSVWSGQAKLVVLATVEGDLGVMPGHEPVLATLADGPIRVDPVDGDPIMFAVHGGFFSLDSNNIQILAEIAEKSDEIDLERAKAAKERATAAGDDPDDVRALRRAETRIDVAMAGQRGGTVR
jgi:F-type H+-transporting ATPase subunit epsilon